MNFFRNALRNIIKPPKVSVVFHIHYEDTALEIIGRLKNVRTPYQLFITHSQQLKKSTLSAIFDLGVSTNFLNTVNIGMDVYPFLCAMEHFSLFDSRVVCKIHTKRGDGVIGETWKNELLDSIIGQGEKFDKNILLMEGNSRIAMLGAHSTYLSAHRAMKDNFSKVLDINQSFLHLDLRKDWGFFAGTIFITRGFVFKEFPKASVLNGKFSVGATKGDGEFAHACERAFGLLPRISEGSVATTRPDWRSGEADLSPTPSGQLISKIMSDLHGLAVAESRREPVSAYPASASH